MQQNRSRINRKMQQNHKKFTDRCSEIAAELTDAAKLQQIYKPMQQNHNKFTDRCSEIAAEFTDMFM